MGTRVKRCSDSMEEYRGVVCHTLIFLAFRLYKGNVGVVFEKHDDPSLALAAVVVFNVWSDYARLVQGFADVRSLYSA